ncbi:uncharacterized protein MEPE_05373 [Melanopsichium pennsylvanicum]|uniref:Uncharacterized protein n=2 Tax=Melanopsichium pennsylvanicum TaxID=63383 RepID=A0AAJ4XPB9_9BASI|nr:putative protein [Melanopsichium pennsylvanicum 4]SNX86664.1 uncharacterized protein MEPE_05373 [Melanopsichium pennsylvanicum]
MSRRVVSYDDISEEAPPLPPPIEAEASPSNPRNSTHLLINGNAKRKRQTGTADGAKGKKRQKKAQQSKVTLHWDDPDFQPHSLVHRNGHIENKEGESYRNVSLGIDLTADGDVEREDDEDEGEEERFYDAMDGQHETHSCGKATSSEGEGHIYNQWKYDEWGELIDRSQTRVHGLDADQNLGNDAEPEYDDVGEHDYEVDDENGGEDRGFLAADYGSAQYDHNGEYPENEEDWDEDLEEDDEEVLPFAIPDVNEFHRIHDTEHLTSTLSHLTATESSSAHHRPPIEVGGGGRVLTHQEVWSDKVIIDAFRAAMNQYDTMHGLTTQPKGADDGNQDTVTGKMYESALWNDAPGWDSLLAQQVKADTEQILAQNQTANKGKHRAVALTVAEGNVDAKADHDGTHGNGKDENAASKSISDTSAKAAALHQPNGRGKPIVTMVPHAHLPGNKAWQRAVKTVQTTPNSIGGFASFDTIPKKGLDTSDTNNADAGDEKGVGGKINAQVEKVEREDRGTMLGEYWYAGYYAGLKANSNNDDTAHSSILTGV